MIAAADTRIDDWAGTLRISKSQLQTFLVCPRKFFYEYVIGQAWEFVPPALPFGRAIHAAGQFFYTEYKRTGGPCDVDRLLEEFATAWAVEGADARIAYDKKTTPAGLAELGAAMLRAFHAGIQPRRIAAVEYPFQVTLRDPDAGNETLDVQLVGRMDLIEEDDDGRPIVSELKTKARSMSDGEAENQLDALVYAYALDELGVQTDEEGGTLVRIDVLTKAKAPALQQLFVRKEAGDYRRLQRWVRDILRAIEAEAFYPIVSWACKQCQFRQACRKAMCS